LPVAAIRRQQQDRLADESRPGRPLAKLRRTRSVGRFDHTPWTVPWDHGSGQEGEGDSLSAQIIRMAGAWVVRRLEGEGLDTVVGGWLGTMVAVLVYRCVADAILRPADGLHFLEGRWAVQLALTSWRCSGNLIHCPVRLAA
jgi:hypothetical protein